MYLSVPGGYKSVPGSHLRFLAVIWDMANYRNIELNSLPIPTQECNSDFGLDKDRKKQSRQGF